MLIHKILLPVNAGSAYCYFATWGFANVPLRGTEMLPSLDLGSLTENSCSILPITFFNESESWVSDRFVS